MERMRQCEIQQRITKPLTHSQQISTKIIHNANPNNGSLHSRRKVTESFTRTTAIIELSTNTSNHHVTRNHQAFSRHSATDSGSVSSCLTSALSEGGRVVRLQADQPEAEVIGTSHQSRDQAAGPHHHRARGAAA